MSTQNEKPIIFSTPMVQAILNGSKIQSRRVIKPQPHTFADRWVWAFKKGKLATKGYWLDHCPYGQVGEKLWVRETFCEHTTGGIIYKADEVPVDGVYSYHKWRPSIHMFRWASRITLEITEVRVERVQDIIQSDGDMRAEGVPLITYDNNRTDWGEMAMKFQELWDSLNAKRGFGWDTNCWCWVITFKKEEN